MMETDKRIMNIISVIGFILSILSIPLFFLCVGQLVALAFCIIGLVDGRQCNNRGSGFAITGIIISSILIILSTLLLFCVVRYGLSSVLSAVDILFDGIEDSGTTISGGIESAGISSDFILGFMLGFFGW